MENKTYVLNRETGKIELYFEKSEYDALSDDQRGSLRSGYLWSRAKKALNFLTFTGRNGLPRNSVLLRKKE